MSQSGGEDRSKYEGLTAKQRRFVQEYMVDRNATKAAIRAGFSEKTASRIGPELLGKTCVAEAIAVAEKKVEEETNVRVHQVIRELALIGFSDLTHYRAGTDGTLTLAPDAPPEAVRAVQSHKRKIRLVPGSTEGAVVEDVEIRLWNKVDALKALGQHLGMFKERSLVEELLAALPTELAREVGFALASALSKGATGGPGLPADGAATGQPAPVEAVPGPAGPPPPPAVGPGEPGG